MATYLITGATGFLGKALTEVLGQQGETYSLGRSASSDIICDLAKEIPSITQQVDVVVHNAGKAHVVPKTQAEEEAFYEVNHQGTLNLLEGITKTGQLPNALIFISTVAVYGRETGDLLAETTSLSATDPYGKSKIMAEEAIIEWGKEHQVTIGILRLPLVAGKQPPGNLHKMLKAQKSGYYFEIGKGDAQRSVVVANDVAAIIPKLAEVGGIYNLSDGQHPTFHELGQAFAQQLGVKPPHAMPLWLAKSLALCGEIGGNLLKRNLPFNQRALSKMTSSLTFSDQKAVKNLTWNPQPVVSYFASLSKTDLLHES